MRTVLSINIIIEENIMKSWITTLISLLFIYIIGFATIEVGGYAYLESHESFCHPFSRQND